MCPDVDYRRIYLSDSETVFLVGVYYSLKVLTHISLASFLWDVSKQHRTRPDAAYRGVLSGT